MWAIDQALRAIGSKDGVELLVGGERGGGGFVAARVGLCIGIPGDQAAVPKWAEWVGEDGRGAVVGRLPSPPRPAG